MTVRFMLLLSALLCCICMGVSPRDADTTNLLGDAPVRMVADDSFIYRIVNPPRDGDAAMLQRVSRTIPPNVEELLPMPSLQVASVRSNAVPIELDGVELIYVSLWLRRLQDRFVDANIFGVTPSKLPQHRTICGLGSPSYEIMRMLKFDEGQVWFDVAQLASRQYLVFTHVNGVLRVRHYDVAAEDVAERSMEQHPLLNVDLVGPFHAFHKESVTYLLEGNGRVSTYDEDNGLRAIGEIRDLRQSNLSSKHIIFRDRSNDDCFILKREGDDLRPLPFTPTKLETPNPFAQELDPDLAKAVLTSLVTHEPQ